VIVLGIFHALRTWRLFAMLKMPKKVDVKLYFSPIRYTTILCNEERMKERF